MFDHSWLIEQPGDKCDGVKRKYFRGKIKEEECPNKVFAVLRITNDLSKQKVDVKLCRRHLAELVADMLYTLSFDRAEE